MVNALAMPSFLPRQRHCWLKVSGLRIHLLTAGNHGKPVLMLHGGGLDAAGLSLGRTIPVLARQYRVFAPDWPGFGKSDPMPITWRVEECVEFLAHLLDALGLSRATLIGVSMGGGFALGFTIRAPERVERLVLVNSAGLGREIPGGVLSYLTMRLPFVDELRWALLLRNRSLARRILCGPLVNWKEFLSEEVLDQIIRLARRAGTGAAFRQLQRSEYQWQGLRTNYSPQLSEVNIPTLIVHGAKDTIVPVSWAERAHSLIRNSKLEIIHECGHMPPVEHPELFNEILRRFLRTPMREQIRKSNDFIVKNSLTDLVLPGVQRQQEPMECYSKGKRVGRESRRSAQVLDEEPRYRLSTRFDWRDDIKQRRDSR
jgi:pimeloyl-ACP methyl ester carboxylesterase